MTPDELRAYEQALIDVENPIEHPVGASGSAKRRANDLGLRLKNVDAQLAAERESRKAAERENESLETTKLAMAQAFETKLAAERERREAAESDAVEDAANAELQLQGALDAQKQAEAQVAGVRCALRLLEAREPTVIPPGSMLKLYAMAVDRVRAALASQPADEQRLRHVLVGDRCKVCGVQFANGLAGTWCLGQPADEREPCKTCSGRGNVVVETTMIGELRGQCPRCKATGLEPADERGEERSK